MVYKIWQVTYVTKKVDGDVTHYIRENIKKERHRSPYLFETDSLSELRKKLMSEKECDRIEFNYDSD